VFHLFLSSRSPPISCGCQLSYSFVEDDGCGGTHVEGCDVSVHGYSDDVVASV